MGMFDFEVDNGSEGVSYHEIMPHSDQVGLLSLDKIATDILQPRDYFDQRELEALAESFKLTGNAEQEYLNKDPIEVRKDGDRYVIVEGERRFRALKLKNATYALVKIVKNDLRDLDLRYYQIALNQHGVACTTLEKAKVICSVLDETNKKQSTIALELNLPESHISKYKKIGKMPLSFIQAVKVNHPTATLNQLLELINLYKLDYELWFSTVSALTLNLGEIKEAVKSKKLAQVQEKQGELDNVKLAQVQEKQGKPDNGKLAQVQEKQGELDNVKLAQVQEKQGEPDNVKLAQVQEKQGEPDNGKLAQVQETYKEIEYTNKDSAYVDKDYLYLYLNNKDLKLKISIDDINDILNNA